MLKVKKNFTLISLSLIVISFITVCCNNKAQLNDCAIENISTSSFSEDSTGFYCLIEWNDITEGEGIKIGQISLNDSLSYLRVKDSNYNPFIQVTLTKPISDYIKSLLYQIYSEHSSAVKDQYINEVTCVTSVTLEWNVEININGRKINDSINILNYMCTFKDPFYPQFEKLISLKYAITRKMNHEIYKLEYTNYDSDDWITEMFHDEYYEPYEDNQKK